MLVISSNAGQLGNSLLVFANFIAFGIESNQIILNPTFKEYANYFQSTSENALCCYPPSKLKIKLNKPFKKAYYGCSRVLASSRFFKTVKVINALSPKEATQLSTYKPEASITTKGKLLTCYAGTKPFNLSKYSIGEFIKGESIVFFEGALMRDGWFIDDRDSLCKHADAIKAYFTPLKEYETNVLKLMSHIKKNADIVIGVHIRQGDYKEHLNGLYFYETEQYAKIMESVQKLFPDKNVAFLICSNSSQDKTIFTQFNYFFGSNHIIEDMYALAHCDYIMGPPSTYSMWAAFYGNKPLYMIRDINKVPELKNFVHFSDWKGILHYRDDWREHRADHRGLGGAIHTSWEWIH